MKKAFTIILSLFILFHITPTDVCAEQTYSWYCKRERDHRQPSLPSEFGFINEYGGIWLNHKVSSEKKTVYLTFDAGYDNGNVVKILDILKEKDVPAAFFILINLINSNPDLVNRMAGEGHAVCNHTAYHKDLTKINRIEDFNEELNKLSEAYRSLTGKDMDKYFRPPEGKFTKESLQFADKLGYKTVFWSFAYADWDNAKQPSAEYAKKKILDNIHNGAVILLHPTSTTNAAILGEVIDEMRRNGYEFGTLAQLCEDVCGG